MTPEDVTEAKGLVEAVRSRPPSYAPEAVQALRLADLLLQSIGEIEKRDRISFRGHHAKGRCRSVVEDRSR